MSGVPLFVAVNKNGDYARYSGANSPSLSFAALGKADLRPMIFAHVGWKNVLRKISSPAPEREIVAYLPAIEHRSVEIINGESE